MGEGSDPERHHYLPKFYIERWAKAKGELIRFAPTPRGEVRYKYASPKAAGFAFRLYETPGVDPEDAQALETNLLQLVDARGAEALRIFLSEQPEPLGHSWRSDWSRFLMSLLYRTPANLETAKSTVAAMWRQSAEERERQYQEIRHDGAPATFEDYLASTDPHLVEKLALDIIARGMENATVGGILNNLHWCVLGPEAGSPSLLTSDEPIRMTEGLGRSDGYLTIPLGPDRLCIGTYERGYLTTLLRDGPTELFVRSNEHVIEQASSQVIAANLDHAELISARFGKGERRNLVGIIAEAVHRDDAATESRPPSEIP